MEVTKAYYGGLAIGEDFVELKRSAEDIHMKVNSFKTQLLIIGPPLVKSTQHQ